MDAPLRHFTFRQLEIFITAARLGSFSRAAEALHLTQPSISLQMKKLTDAVGLPLFAQVNRRLYLTEAGESLARACGESFQAMERFAMESAEIKGLRLGTLRLGIVNTAQYVVPALLAPFLKRHDGIHVALEVDNATRLTRRLRNNLDSIYVFSSPPQIPEAEETVFLPNPMVALAAPGHPLAGKRNIPLARFAREPFVTREQGSETRRVLERLFTEHGLTLDVRMEVGHSEAIKRTVAAGLGVTALSAHTVDAGDPSLVVLDVEHFPLQRHWYLVRRKDRDLPLVAQAFMDYVTDEALPPGLPEAAFGTVARRGRRAKAGSASRRRTGSRHRQVKA